MSEVVSILNLVTTAALCGLTAWYVFLTRRLVKIQIEPMVVVYLSVEKTSDLSPVYIVVENIGRGIATNIEVDYSPPVAQLIGPSEDAIPDSWKRISFLQPGGNRHFIWGHYSDLVEKYTGVKFNVSCRFRDGSTSKKTASVLDLGSFHRTVIKGAQ